MALGLEEALGPEILKQKHLLGWVNVPANCVRQLQSIHLHAARPAGINEPCAAGVAGAEEILRRVGGLRTDDLCLALISGGGSALLPAPAPGITLADKLAVTRHLSAAGADIRQLNTVRKPLSRIKGGGLVAACGAGRLIALIISDVIGDPLDIIASGITVEDRTSPEAALAILKEFDPQGTEIPESVYDFLRNRVGYSREAPCCAVTNHVIGNIATAESAAGQEANRLGYATTIQHAMPSEGFAEDVGRQLARTALEMRLMPGKRCLISGGEPVVRLIRKGQRGLGGRNQQLALAASQVLDEAATSGMALLSGGTDGEDGPTDAAGAFIDHSILNAARQQRLDAADFLARNDAYHYFQQLNALLKTGPTHTNVCDLRVVLTDEHSAG